MFAHSKLVIDGRWPYRTSLLSLLDSIVTRERLTVNFFIDASILYISLLCSVFSLSRVDMVRVYIYMYIRMYVCVDVDVYVCARFLCVYSTCRAADRSNAVIFRGLRGRKDCCIWIIVPTAFLFLSSIVRSSRVS